MAAIRNRRVENDRFEDVYGGFAGSGGAPSPASQPHSAGGSWDARYDQALGKMRASQGMAASLSLCPRRVADGVAPHVNPFLDNAKLLWVLLVLITLSLSGVVWYMGPPGAGPGSAIYISPIEKHMCFNCEAPPSLMTRRAVGRNAVVLITGCDRRDAYRAAMDTWGSRARSMDWPVRIFAAGTLAECHAQPLEDVFTRFGTMLYISEGQITNDAGEVVSTLSTSDADRPQSAKDHRHPAVLLAVMKSLPQNILDHVSFVTFLYDDVFMHVEVLAERLVRLQAQGYAALQVASSEDPTPQKAAAAAAAAAAARSGPSVLFGRYVGVRGRDSNPLPTRRPRIPDDGATGALTSAFPPHSVPSLPLNPFVVLRKEEHPHARLSGGFAVASTDLVLQVRAAAAVLGVSGWIDSGAALTAWLVNADKTRVYDDGLVLPEVMDMGRGRRYRGLRLYAQRVAAPVRSTGREIHDYEAPGAVAAAMHGAATKADVLSIREGGATILGRCCLEADYRAAL